MKKKWWYSAPLREGLVHHPYSKTVDRTGFVAFWFGA